MHRTLKGLFQDPEFTKYFFNTSWLLAHRVVQLILGVGIAAILARYLAPAQFGLLNYAQSFVFLFSSIATLGLDDIVVRELVKGKTHRDVLLGTSFGLRCIGSLTICILIISIQHYIEPDIIVRNLIVIFALTPILQSFNVVGLYFQSHAISKHTVFANFISLFFSFILKLYLIFINAPLILFALSYIFDALILALGFLYFYQKQRLHWLAWRFSWGTAITLLRNSWPIMFSGIFISCSMRIDQIMLKHMLGNDAVGLYSAAVGISEAWYFIPVAIMSSLYPTIVIAKHTDEDLYLRKLQKFFTLMVWLGLGMALFMTFFSDLIIKLVYGSHYISAAGILKVHAWTGVLVAYGVARGAWIINQNLQIFALFLMCTGVLTNIAFNLYFIPKYGVIGAALGTLLSYILSAIILPIAHPVDKTTVPMFLKSFYWPWQFLRK